MPKGGANFLFTRLVNVAAHFLCSTRESRQSAHIQYRHNRVSLESSSVIYFVEVAALMYRLKLCKPSIYREILLLRGQPNLMFKIFVVIQIMFNQLGIFFIHMRADFPWY